MHQCTFQEDNKHKYILISGRGAYTKMVSIDTAQIYKFHI
jgi:hypothetical protein